MIEFTRSFARQLRDVFRRCVRKPYGAIQPLVQFQTRSDGMRVRLAREEFAVQFHQAGSFDPEVMHLPYSALSDLEGSAYEMVMLEGINADKVIARWCDQGVPQVVEYDSIDRSLQPAFPDLPDRFVPNSSNLLKALEEAVKSTAKERIKYALDRVQLRGLKGDIAASDSKQALIQGGFSFPFEESLLVTSLPVFGSPELDRDLPVEVGKTDKHVVLRVGSWTIWLLIDAKSRMPPIDEVIPRQCPGSRRWSIAPEDAVFLARTLPRLPNDPDRQGPLTVDLNGQVVLRARGPGNGRVMEAVLSRSSYTGDPLRFCMHRQNLVRAVQLGFPEVQIASPGRPLVCRDEKRTFAFMPFSTDDAIAPTPEALRIVSGETDNLPKFSSPRERKNPVMTTPTEPNNASDNGQTATPRKPRTAPSQNGRGGLAVLVGEAQALREGARDLFTRSNRLIAGMKKYRKQAKLTASTLASLRQLHQIDA